MKITDALLGEHGSIYALFDHLDLALPDVGSRTEAVHLAGMLAATLRSHSKLEDELLFPAIAERIGDGGPLAVMRAEHEEIDEALTAAVGAADVAGAIAALRDAIDVARPHFYKEESILFRIAAEAIPAAKLEELGAAWARARKVNVAR